MIQSIQSYHFNFDVSYTELNETQREFQELARKFAQDEIIPVAAEHDRTGAFPWDIVKKAHKLGLMNGHIPAEFGKYLSMCIFQSNANPLQYSFGKLYLCKQLNIN